MAKFSVTTADLRQRIAAAQAGLQARGWGAMLVSPGPDLTYLTGYDAIPLERLTCLVMRDGGDRSAMQMFAYSILYLFLLFALVLVDRTPAAA